MRFQRNRKIGSCAVITPDRVSGLLVHVMVPGVLMVLALILAGCAQSKEKFDELTMQSPLLDKAAPQNAAYPNVYKHVKTEEPSASILSVEEVAQIVDASEVQNDALIKKNKKYIENTKLSIDD